MQYSWYTNSDKLNSESIHQILSFGSLKDIRALKKTLGEKALKEIFIASPQKIYTASSLNFIAKFILHISTSVDEQRYLKDTPRHTR